MMSTYKVGDLASLMSSSSKKKPDTELQSLFKKHWNKRSQNAAKSTENQIASDCDIERKTTKKKKFHKSSSPKGHLKETMKTDSNIDLVSPPNKKKRVKKNNSNLEEKQNSSPSEDFLFKSKKQNVEHPNNRKAFIRCAKNKRQKTVEPNGLDTVRAEDNLFSEYSDSENTSNHQSKKRKHRKISSNVSPSVDAENQENSKNNSNHPSKKRKLQKISSNVSSSVDTENQEDSENTFNCTFKKQRHHKIPSTVSSSVDAENQEVTDQVEESKVGIEKIRLDNIQDLPCTLFVGNLPVSVNRKMLHKLFASFGQIKSVRLRGAVSTKMSIPKKVAEIKNEYHKGLQSHTGFVVFKDEESAKNALSLNQTLIDNHHILVDFANKAGEKKLYNNDLSVFLGNLPFDVDDETVRSAFENCGKIQAVRIIRDKDTGLGKGFGYVQFQKIKAKEDALTLNDVEIKGRKIRVKPVDNNHGSKTGSKKTLTIRTKRQTKGYGSRKSAKKLLKRGKLVHQKKQVARLFGEKFVK